MLGEAHGSVDQAPSLLSSAQAPSAHLGERYELLRSIVLRNEHFLPPLALAAGQERAAYMKVRGFLPVRC